MPYMKWLAGGVGALLMLTVLLARWPDVQMEPREAALWIRGDEAEKVEAMSGHRQPPNSRWETHLNGEDDVEVMMALQGGPMIMGEFLDADMMQEVVQAHTVLGDELNADEDGVDQARVSRELGEPLDADELLADMSASVEIGESTDADLVEETDGVELIIGEAIDVTAED